MDASQYATEQWTKTFVTLKNYFVRSRKNNFNNNEIDFDLNDYKKQVNVFFFLNQK